MTQVEFAPVEVKSWSCMYCGCDRPEDVDREIFHGWTCPDCGHIVCGRCLSEIKEVNKLPECTWWHCETTKVAKVNKLREAIVSPKLSFAPEESYLDAPVLMANKTHVHWLGDNGDWSELVGVTGVNIEMNNDIQMMRPAGGPARAIMGATRREATMEVVLDERNMNMFAEGGIYVVSMETSDGVKTRFRGMLTTTREQILAGEPVTMEVQLVEVESAEYSEKPTPAESVEEILYSRNYGRRPDGI